MILLPERRYLNFKDFMKFPTLGMSSAISYALKTLQHKMVVEGKSLLKVIQQKDLLLHYPCNPFIISSIYCEKRRLIRM